VCSSDLAIFINVLVVSLTIKYFQHRAIALSMSCTMVINFLFLMTMLYRHLGGYSVSYLLQGLAKILAATAGLTGFLLIILPYAKRFLMGSLESQAISLALVIAGSALLYSALLHVLRLAEFTTLTSAISRRLRKSR
jgi:putative peptidoglycan lipid II flippase